MNANGSRRHSLSPATVYEEGPALSRDGRRIAFGRRGEIYVMSSSGSNVHRLTFSPAQEGAPAWSSDGRWIAYSSYRSGKSDIWKMRSDGGGKTRLTRTASLEDVPDWSPDGRRIVYAGPQARIWVMRAERFGAASADQERSRRRSGLGPAWSPRGTLIAYEFSGGTSPVNPTNEIWLMNADGSHPVRLTNNQLEDGQPTWSPDGAGSPSRAPALTQAHSTSG